MSFGPHNGQNLSRTDSRGKEGEGVKDVKEQTILDLLFFLFFFVVGATFTELTLLISALLCVPPLLYALRCLQTIESSSHEIVR